MLLDTRQLHVKVGDRGLNGMIGDVAAEVQLGIVRAGYQQIPRRVLREVLSWALRTHIVGLDTCGLGALCRDAEEFDPWEAEALGETG